MNLGTVNRLSAGTLRPPVGGARPNKGGYSTDIAGEDIRAWGGCVRRSNGNWSRGIATLSYRTFVFERRFLLICDNIFFLLRILKACVTELPPVGLLVTPMMSAAARCRTARCKRAWDGWECQGYLVRMVNFLLDWVC